MADTDNADHTKEASAPREPLFGVHDLPERVLETYARLWQLETWLRPLVYVQLRAKAGDAWDAQVQRALRPKTNDKQLTHMPTAHESLLSYAQLSELRLLIADNWPMFESYLPPQKLWEAKLDEVMQIRHRVAHFRSTHEDDLPRVLQLLRDMDAGMFRFVTSYNDPTPVLPATADAVIAEFIELDPFPWTQVQERRWARVGRAPEDLRVSLTLEVLRMPWVEWAVPVAGAAGFLYSVNIYARHRRRLHFKQLLASTQSLHKHLAHVCLDSGETGFRLTIPACIGKDLVISVVRAFHEAALYTLGPSRDFIADERVQRFADTQPEYVLGPRNPLTFLTPEMPCTFFGA